MRFHENRGTPPQSSFRMMKMPIVLFMLSGLALLNTDFLSSGRRALAETRKLCRTVFDYPDWKQYWEDLFAPTKKYVGLSRALVPLQPTNIGYFLTLTSCPSDAYTAGDPYDPGHAFYDAAALLKYSIYRNTYPAKSKYNATMYAIVHPDAIVCKGPNHEEYDRVKVLQDLGYKVTIVGSPIYKSRMTPYLKENINLDAGDRDFMRLEALTYEEHPVVVLVDFTTLMMKPIDGVFDQFIADPSQKIRFTYDYPTNLPNTGSNSGMNQHWIMLKPSRAFFETLADAYEKSVYSPLSGWNNRNVKNFKGVLGLKGFLVHWFTRVEPAPSGVMSRCRYGNDASNPRGLDASTGSVVCRDPLDCEDCRQVDLSKTVKVIKMIHTCGKPWDCFYDDNWDATTKAACEGFHRAWFQARIDFEQSCWVSGPPSFRTGAFKPEIFMGFCNCKGVTCYDRMIDDKAAALTCDKDTQTNSNVARMTFPSGGYQDHVLSLTTGQVTGATTACLTGKIALKGFDPPYNLGIVIDVSGSTAANFKGTPVGDVNKDTKSNTILDAELAAVLAVLDNIAQSPNLGNDNVNIGLVQFSTDAQYLGKFDPVDATNSSNINPVLKKKITDMRPGGYTHFDDALDKIVEYFQEAPPNRNNILMFLSDGIPNVVGDGDQEEATNKYVNNQPGALNYDSELALLDQYNVKRIAVGVGSGADVRPGFGLDKIDNTPDPYTGLKPTLAKSSDALKGALLNNPIAGELIDFSVVVNGVLQNFDTTHVVGGPTGFYFGRFVVAGLDPRHGSVNEITVSATLDYDGMDATTDDQSRMVTTNYLPGTLFQ